MRCPAVVWGSSVRPGVAVPVRAHGYGTAAGRAAGTVRDKVDQANAGSASGDAGAVGGRTDVWDAGRTAGRFC